MLEGAGGEVLSSLTGMMEQSDMSYDMPSSGMNNQADAFDMPLDMVVFFLTSCCGHSLTKYLNVSGHTNSSTWRTRSTKPTNIQDRDFIEATGNRR